LSIFLGWFIETEADKNEKFFEKFFMEVVQQNGENECAVPVIYRGYV
jgi:hypothetical protein